MSLVDLIKRSAWKDILLCSQSPDGYLYVSQGFVIKYLYSIVSLAIFLSELCLQHWWHYMSEVQFLIQSVNPQPCHFTNNSLSLPHAPSLSVCLFLWVCVVCVSCPLYLSFYLCYARCVFCIWFYIPNHLFVFFLFFLQIQLTPLLRCLLMYA